MPAIVARILLGLATSALIGMMPTAAAAATRHCAIPIAVELPWPDSSVSSPAMLEYLQRIKPAAGTNLFFSRESLFRLDDDRPIRLGAGTRTGVITVIQPIGGTILVGAWRGLFRLEGDVLRELSKGTNTGGINAIRPVGGAILVGAGNGLFRLEARLQGDVLTQMGAGTRTGEITDIQPIGGTILVGADMGLFRLDGGVLTQLDKDTVTEGIIAIQPVGDTILVRTRKGLFRLDGGVLTQLGKGTETGTIAEIRPVGGTILIAADDGLFRLAGDVLTQLGKGTKTGRVTKIQPIGDTILVGAENGLFRLEGDVLTQLGAGTKTGWITEIQPVGGVILLGAQNGLFRLQGDDMQEVMSERQLPSFPAMWWIGDQLWIAALNELFRYIIDTDRASGPKDPLAFGTGTTAALRFTPSLCLGLLQPSQFGLLPDASTPFAVATSPTPITTEFTIIGNPTRRVLSATVGPLPAGTWRVRLAVKAVERWEPVSDPVELRVDWTPANYATHFIGQAIPWLGAVHTGLFVLLLAGARRFRWCWRVLSDPIWGRLGLWWHAALRHVPALQRWVLARWFDTARRRDWRPYLPVPIAAPDGAVLAADALLDRLRTQQRLWVQGGAGMGKSALVDELSRQFFADHASLRAAFRRYGFVPLVVRLRDVLDVKADPAQHDRWVPELARLALRANGMRVDDPALFRTILESGYFALILDGANETANAAALEDYARTTSEVRILVTSQADPVKPGFEVLRLPGSVEEMVGPLLSLFLGPARGAAVLEAMRSTPLWDGLASGYDVRLLADLAGRDGPTAELPADRIGLYRALLARLRYASGPYPEEELSRAAWAMWRDGVRQFDGTKYLTPDLIEPLRHENARVVRTIGGTLQEFRHDQMRGYLAALGAARFEVAPIRLFETDKAIWRLYFHEQAPVWEFFAALVDQARGEAIWQWCHDDPERAVLLHALDQQGRKEGWQLVRNAPEQVVPNVAR